MKEKETKVKDMDSKSSHKSEGFVEPVEKEFQEELIKVGRIVKVTKGGRKFRFSAMMAIGDGNARVGIGHGKSKEIPDATQKAIGMAKKRLVSVFKKNTTIPHEVIGRFGSTAVMLRPARRGTGVIAGWGVRSVVSKIGIQDVFSKVYGSKNPLNVVYATLEALKLLQNPEEVARKRGKKVNEIFQ